MGRQPQLPLDGEQLEFARFVTTSTWHCTPPASALQTRRASCLACHSGTECAEVEGPLCDGPPAVGIFGEPPALQPAITSAATSGENFKNAFTNAPSHESIWEGNTYKTQAFSPIGRSASRDQTCSKRRTLGDIDPRHLARAQPSRLRNRGKGHERLSLPRGTIVGVALRMLRVLELENAWANLL
jgi:hypothetical protein